jgi:putative transposase
MVEAQVLDRQRAIQRYLKGERPATIYRSLGYSREWFYKWLRRYRTGAADWAEERERRPHRSPRRIPARVETVIVATRQLLRGRQLFAGAQAIAWELADAAIEPPSLRTIARILARHELVTRQPGPYVAKGTPYPALRGERPGQVQQTDFVGPCYLQGPQRFYSLHSVDLASGRCAVEALTARSSQPMIDALWAIWTRLGIPQHQQVDNEMVFYGSRAHPRGLGPLIRLCLACDVEPWFIPPAEPWRNGVVEKFNAIWQQHGPLRQRLASLAALRRASLAFEVRHNARHRYSKLGGTTPDRALAASGATLRFPTAPTPPQHPLPKPERGRYHLVRFVRSDGRVDLFGEVLRVPPEAVYTYVRATIDVARQRLAFVLDGRVIDEQRFLLR